MSAHDTARKIVELAALVGQKGTVPALDGAIRVGVKVLDVKQSYGKTRYLVQPLVGLGSAWVENFTLVAETK